MTDQEQAEQQLFEKLVEHDAHNAFVISYGDPPQAISIECTECNEVLVSARRPVEGKAVSARIEKTGIHVLWRGLALCEFSREHPSRWPKGNTWVSLENPVTPPTCPECKKSYDAITATLP